MSNPNIPVKFRVCDACGHYSDKLTARGFCPKCEEELRRVIAAVNATERKAQ